jgi:hypothetical protein
MEKKEKKVGSDGRFMYEYITFLPSKTKKPYIILATSRINTIDPVRGSELPVIGSSLDSFPSVKLIDR